MCWRMLAFTVQLQVFQGLPPVVLHSRSQIKGSQGDWSALVSSSSDAQSLVPDSCHLASQPMAQIIVHRCGSGMRPHPSWSCMSLGPESASPCGVHAPAFSRSAAQGKPSLGCPGWTRLQGSCSLGRFQHHEYGPTEVAEHHTVV